LLAFSEFNEELFSFFETIFDRLNRFFWKVLVFDDKLMEVIPKKISTNMPPMTIVYAKK
jgi:hypothetical protein